MEKVEKLKALAFEGTYHLNEAMTMLQNGIDQLEKDRQQALKQVQQWNKDEEIVRLNQEIQRLKQQLSSGYSYHPTPEEKEAIERAKETHRQVYAKGHHHHSYIITPTELGEVLEVVCLDCQGIVYQTNSF